jgi:flagellar hook-associated protein 1 FlgK
MREPGQITIGTTLDDLWTAFAQLTTSPGSVSSRWNVLHKAQSVVDTFHEVTKEVTALRAEVGERTQFSVQQVNSLAQSLASVNQTLATTAAAGSGAAPNTLLDKRDLLVRELAQYVKVDVAEQAHGAIKLSIGGRTLLEGDVVQQLSLTTADDGSLLLAIHDTPISPEDVGGTLGGELTAFNRDLPHYLQLLDDFAQSVITQVNGLHGAGYDADGNQGGAFFTGSTAGDISLDIGIKGLPHRLAMSAAPDGFDGLVAQQLADLREKSWSDAPTLSEQYASMITTLGSQVASLKVNRDVNHTLVDFAQERVHAVSGVNIDEELVDMVRYQQAYGAAARVLTSIDEALDVLINRTGLVGR